MSNQDAKALGCLWLLGSGILSVLVPALMSGMDVESQVAWYILAPGWVLSPFGHADLPAMFLALFIDLFIYAAVTRALIYLAVRAAGREKLSVGE